MANVASILRQEMLRLARKEARAHTLPLKRALARDRKELTGLKRRLGEQLRQLGRLESALKRQAAAAGHGERNAVEADLSAKWRKDTVRSTRRRLRVTQTELARMLGVAVPTISLWETGKTEPRARQKVAILALRELDQEEVAQRLRAG